METAETMFRDLEEEAETGSIKCAQCGRGIDGATVRRMITVAVHVPHEDRQDYDTSAAALCGFKCLTEWSEAQE